MRARRVYATTGARIRAAVTVDGRFIGEKYPVGSSCEIKVNVEGTGPLEKIEVYRGLDLIHTEDLSGPPTGSKIRVLWNGAAREQSYSGISWDGHIDVGDGEIGDVTPIRFDSPRSHYGRVSSSRLDVDGWACGYPSGVVIDLDKVPTSDITVAMNSQLVGRQSYGKTGAEKPIRMGLAPGGSTWASATMAQLADRAVKVELGHLTRSVILELAPEPAMDRVEFTVNFDGIKPGVNPIWVKIVQQDMEMAWISPVFAENLG